MTNQFLGYPPEAVDYLKARAVVIPVPFEASVSYGEGTALGPSAILAASAQVELFDSLLQRSLPDFSVFTETAVNCDHGYDCMASELQARVTRVLEAGKMPVVLGGEHSLSVSAVAAFAGLYPGGTVIHVDAHADLRDSYEGKKWSHACAMRRIREFGLQTVSIGIRSMSEEEYHLIQKEGITVISSEIPDFLREVKVAISRLQGPAWLTFDVDGLDPQILPSTGTPEPGGLSWRETMNLLQIIQDSVLEMKGFDVVELAPIPQMHHADFTIAKLIHRMIMAFY